MPAERDELLRRLAANRPAAHALFFRSRHQNEDAPFHHEMERDWASAIPNILTMAFRGSAKSTKAEEAITLEVAFQRTKNVLILGESEERAAERLAAIKNHIEYNEELAAVFDLEPGDPWQATRACTSTGIMMQAYGRGQSLRGVKYLNNRPDLIFGDDLEDPESVASETLRTKTLHWFTRTVMPVLPPGGRMRIAATPLHPEALAPTLARNTKFWVVKTYPLLYIKDDSAEASSWPDRFPLPAALEIKEKMLAQGDAEGFAQEYQCQASDPATKTFTQDMFRVVPRIRSWQPVYALYDPARTTNTASATTGKCVASWIGRKLVIWESSAQKWMPSEIIDDIFRTNASYSPTTIGVEENGLNEWLLQPIRARSIETGSVIPLRGLSAPRGKLDFIRGLQPYFKAGEVEFATEMPELRAQLLGFPNGLIDAPNALAYMLRLGLGVPVYDNFREECIDEDARPRRSAPFWLLINTNSQVTSAVLVQMQEGRVVVLTDWLVESDAGTCLTDIVKDAQLEMSAGVSPPVGVSAPRKAERGVVSFAALRYLAPRQHFDGYSLHGLKAAARASQIHLEAGGDAIVGREGIRSVLRRIAHGRPALAVNPRASWTLRALAGGYARDADKQESQANAYTVLMEALESFMALTRAAEPALADQPNYAYTEDGRRYISALAR